MLGRASPYFFGRMLHVMFFFWGGGGCRYLRFLRSTAVRWRRLALGLAASCLGLSGIEPSMGEDLKGNPDLKHPG